MAYFLELFLYSLKGMILLIMAGATLFVMFGGTAFNLKLVWRLLVGPFRLLTTGHFDDPNNPFFKSNRVYHYTIALFGSLALFCSIFAWGGAYYCHDRREGLSFEDEQAPIHTDCWFCQYYCRHFAYCRGEVTPYAQAAPTGWDREKYPDFMDQVEAEAKAGLKQGTK